MARSIIFHPNNPPALYRGVVALLLGVAMPTLLLATEAGEAMAEGAEKKPGLPQFDYTTFVSQLFWLVLTFGVFFWLVRTFFAPKIDKTISHRQKTLNDNIKEAEKLLANSKKMEEQVEEKLQAARARARQDLSDVNNKITERQEKAMKEFQHSADKVLQDNEKKLQTMRANILANKDAVVRETSQQIVKKLLAQ